MRTLFLALMIALLPLRGWVGDVMAMELMAPALATSPAQAAPHHKLAADCGQVPAHHGHAMADEPCGDAQAIAGDCSTCTACQICHSVALAPVLHQPTTPQSALATPQSRLPQDVSAERAPGFKPPIF